MQHEQLTPSSKACPHTLVTLTHFGSEIFSLSCSVNSWQIAVTFACLTFSQQPTSYGTGYHGVFFSMQNLQSRMTSSLETSSWCLALEKEEETIPKKRRRMHMYNDAPVSLALAIDPFFFVLMLIDICSLSYLCDCVHIQGPCSAVQAIFHVIYSARIQYLFLDKEVFNIYSLHPKIQCIVTFFY